MKRIFNFAKITVFKNMIKKNYLNLQLALIRTNS